MQNGVQISQHQIEGVRYMKIKQRFQQIFRPLSK
jgi:hypothetical protein